MPKTKPKPRQTPWPTRRRRSGRPKPIRTSSRTCSSAWTRPWRRRRRWPRIRTMPDFRTTRRKRSRRWQPPSRLWMRLRSATKPRPGRKRHRLQTTRPRRLWRRPQRPMRMPSVTRRSWPAHRMPWRMPERLSRMRSRLWPMRRPPATPMPSPRHSRHWPMPSRPSVKPKPWSRRPTGTSTRQRKRCSRHGTIRRPQRRRRPKPSRP